MKKLLLVFLSVCILLLPACHQQDSPTEPTTDGSELSNWNWLYWHVVTGDDCAFSQERTMEDGSTQTVTYNYDGEKFNVTDVNGTRSYSHLVLDEVLEKNENGYQQKLYMLLSDDAAMTYSRYQEAQKLMGNLPNLVFPPTELGFVHTIEMGSAKAFGTAPSHMDSMLSAISKGQRTYYGKNSFFVKNMGHLAFTDATLSPVYQYFLVRYAYDGTLLCSVEAPENIQTLTELSDGGFVAVTNDEQVLCYSSNGTLRWQYQLEANYIPYLFQVGRNLYCLGNIDAEQCDDLYFCKFSIDGDLIAEKIVGGSDFERLSHVIPTEDGFTLYGFTQSRDGDLPFSKDGYGVDFRAHLSLDLEFTDVTKLPDGDYLLTQVGFYNGTAIHDNDPILLPRSGDRLPADTHVQGIYAWEGGYVILRVYTMDVYPFSHPLMSYLPHYRQLIATGYDANGNPIWQTVSEPCVN